MKHLTIAELAQRWNLNRGTLANWRYQKVGPGYVKNGRQILYPIDEVAKYEKAHTTITRLQKVRAL